MSLQVWLPLNGTIENKGLGTVAKESGTATFDKTGKLNRKALNLKYSNSFLCPQLANLKTFSVCFWGMAESSSTLKTLFPDLLGFTCISSNGVSVSDFRWETCYGDYYKVGISAFEGKKGISSLDVSGVVYTSKKDEWVHCCVVFDAESEKIYSYSNGVLKQTHEHLGGSFNSDGRFKIGETNNIEGRIQDVRFYDHALSPKEVKEISKGLCLHYRLSGHGCENLLTNSYNFDDWNGSGTLDNVNTYNGASSIRTNRCWHGPYLNLKKYSNAGTIKKGDILTYSIFVKADADLNNCSFSCYRFITASQDFNVHLNLKKNIWQKLYYTFQATDYTLTTETARFEYDRPYDDGYIIKGGAHVYYALPKLEFSSKATPWVPNSSDALYATLGYNSTVEPDCSSFGNDGTKVGTIACDGDTTRYTTSYKFNGSEYIASDSESMNWWDFSQGTISVWLNPTSAPSGWSGSFGIQHKGNSAYKTFSISNYGGKFTVHVANGNWTFYQSDALPLNEWSFLVATINGTELKMYINGILKLTKTISWNTATISTNTRMVLANDMPGTEELYNGKASDFRFYATALSSEDVLDLYQTGASIDSSGNAWAYEYKEGE